LGSLCGLFGNSRQAYYQYKKGNIEKEIREQTMLEAARCYRQEAPRLGAYKLYLMLCKIFGREQMIGRDSFYAFLRRKHLMLSPLKCRRTTDSNHRFHKYKNLVREFTPTAVGQLWVSDITYIALLDGVCYLHLITDAYSHKIIGWILASGLHAKYSIEALEMAIAQTNNKELKGLIHHSDRGCQYCCDRYVEILKAHQISISMTEDSKPTDNAIAERVNGILKTEWLYLMQKFVTISQAQKELERIIGFYNTKRPHMSNGMLTPEQAHLAHGELKRCWKKKIYKKKEEEMQLID